MAGKPLNFLFNPESTWERPSAVSVDPLDVERRLGSDPGSLELLSGGRANVNVRVGSDRVLRIYRRDRNAVGKEKSLLQLPWESFVVPAVLESGEDFLILEYVPHGLLADANEQGLAVGRALAEIHRRRFPQAGFLDADLAVRTPFTDVFDAFTAYAASELDRAAVESDLRARLDAFLTAHRTLLQRMTDPPVLLQGDFKVSNLLWTTDERLLVLDWEFAYSGPALMDIGQLLRWDPSASFVSGFADSYRRHGGVLLEGWQRAAEVFDLINLIGLLGGAEPGSRQSIDVRHRIEQTLGRRVGDFA